MKHRNKFWIIICLHLVLCVFSQTAGAEEQHTGIDRTYWVDLLYRIAEPVLSNMSRGELKKNMPVAYSPAWINPQKEVAYMEVFARLMVGIAPWLDLPDDDTAEGEKRKIVREWALSSYANAVNPDSPDCLTWTGINQVLVDAAFIANSFIRAPKTLWQPLDTVTKQRYINAFKGLRQNTPVYNNWLLFRAMIEIFLASIDEDYDGYVIDVTIRKMNEWYLGDGWYGDGPEFSFDYYNSFVIQPMLVETIEIMEQKKIYSHISFDLALRRMQRYNQLIERLISPEAAFPVVGRSITYRMGVFHTLALSAWKYGLPKTMSNGQVRNALTQVMKRIYAVEGNFNQEGFLQLGFAGYQPDIADTYINTGSVYLTTLVFLPLGLTPDHPFWTSPAEEWTSLKVWNGKPILKDYHESIKQ